MSEISCHFFILSEILFEICPKLKKLSKHFYLKISCLKFNSPKFFEVNVS